MLDDNFDAPDGPRRKYVTNRIEHVPTKVEVFLTLCVVIPIIITIGYLIWNV